MNPLKTYAEETISEKLAGKRVIWGDVIEAESSKIECELISNDKRERDFHDEQLNPDMVCDPPGPDKAFKDLPLSQNSLVSEILLSQVRYLNLTPPKRFWGIFQ